MPSNYVKNRYVSNRPIYLNEEHVGTVGTGTSIVFDFPDGRVVLKSLVAGANMTITDGGNIVTLASSAGGAGQPPGPYDDDADAASNGVAVGESYYLPSGNLLGLPEGSVIVRIS